MESAHARPDEQHLVTADLSFLTPYWTGREMMTVHLESVRAFYPDAPILISKRGGDREEMEAHRAAFGVEYALEDCSHTDAVLRLFSRCTTEYVCILDHDIVLLTSLDPYVNAIRAEEYDLVGFEERVREPASLIESGIAPELNGWLRLAPGCTGVNFLIFNLRQFLATWGLRGVEGVRSANARHFEFDYGIGQRLTRHKYVLPYHTSRYGMGNLLMDGDTRVAWHQWYGSYGLRLSGVEGERLNDARIAQRVAHVKEAERAFLDDYPMLDLSGLTPAWGPDRDAEKDLAALPAPPSGGSRARMARVRGWMSYSPSEIFQRVISRLDRWWRLRSR